jgi:hypothetical protein
MGRQILVACAIVTFACCTPLIGQQPFDSPDSAALALVEAAENHDAARLSSVLGSHGRDILTSGDPAQDRSEQSEFARLFRTRHQLKPDPRDPHRVIMSIGDKDWPFPVPIVQRNGKWGFDPSESKVEMQARRIGANELDAIEICGGYVEAQKQYASREHNKAGTLTYAWRIMGPPGSQDGLYSEGAGEALVPRGLAEAEWNGKAKPYHGYYFRILNGQGSSAPGGARDYRVKNKLIGGFGLVAWPAEYGVSGIHTFIVNHNGVVYQKDIALRPGGGPSPVTVFDPDSSWSPVE